jgi:alkylation response protein AidB-like acyl-CoA dehydrogenase
MVKNSMNMSDPTLMTASGADGDERRALRELSSSVARERYAPKAEEWDRGAVPFPHDERRYLGSLGLLGITLPEAYGGAGSGATDMTTRAVPAGGAFIVSGTKRWISNGSEADHYLVYARMSDAPAARGIGAIIVDAAAPGVSFGVRERLMGFRGIPSADVIFDNVEVPADNVVIGPGGFRRLFTAFSVERLGNTTMSLGIGQAALDRTISYVQQRQQFGKPLIEFQAVQMQLADIVLQVEAARQLLYRAAATAGTGLPEPFEVSVAKCTANEMAKRVTDLAMQLHGGNGYTEEYGLERLHRDAHGWALAGGTPNMQRIRIVSELLGRNFDQRR